LRKHASFANEDQEKKPKDPGDLAKAAIRNHFNFETEVKKNIMQNPKLKTMQKLIQNNLLEVADDKVGSKTFGGLLDPLNVYNCPSCYSE